MKSFLFVCCMLVAFTMNAQNPNPVTWRFSSKKTANPNEYILVAKAVLKEGYHVFAPDPGGDGLLIPTEITVTNKEKFKKIGPLTPTRKPITKQIEGIGMVNYYEGEIEFTVTVVTDKEQTIQGTLGSQCCNEQMCFPPSDAPFNIKL